MSTFIELPTPLPSDSIGPGYIVTVPFNDIAPSFSLRPQHQPEVHIKEQSIITQNAHDGLGTTKFISQRKDSVTLNDEDSTQISLIHPQASFNDLRNDPKTHASLRTAAVQHPSLFYVTSVRVVSPLTEASAGAIRPPTHVTSSTPTSGKVVGVELSKVKCRVGAADEPHALDDLEYDWSYHALEDGVQLSIGLGKAVTEDEIRGCDGGEKEDEVDWMDEGWDYDEDDDESGLGGF
ncbi:hypothetical protein HBI56_044740 [Parastagonospora nodorum]|nr:hypothetical protein HBH53_168030 [Parastagonospora nodorum]KAH3977389.1 hypothetical protein HBH52_110890 [Parastagonospora nodorum]KAH4011852.1 hypothetical protein HBI09_225720 [Parastagonospora nodorum]KAH4051565.1 hypothetical protein HBH49_119560 [Parastagonospora nodorum]KAH4121313.1 hypothetical protein HBH47_098770 [Parastagonospora nodorum]